MLAWTFPAANLEVVVTVQRLPDPSLTPTSQVEGTTSDNSAAMTAPGSPPVHDSQPSATVPIIGDGH